jgi:hypothetical protein
MVGLESVNRDMISIIQYVHISAKYLKFTLELSTIDVHGEHSRILFQALCCYNYAKRS